MYACRLVVSFCVFSVVWVSFLELGKGLLDNPVLCEVTVCMYVGLFL